MIQYARHSQPKNSGMQHIRNFRDVCSWTVQQFHKQCPIMSHLNKLPCNACGKTKHTNAGKDRITLGRLGPLGGLAVGPLGRPAASPGFTLLGRSSLDTLDPGRSKARSPMFMKPNGVFLVAFWALLPALSAAPDTYTSNSNILTVRDETIMDLNQGCDTRQTQQIETGISLLGHYTLKSTVVIDTLSTMREQKQSC